MNSCKQVESYEVNVLSADHTSNNLELSELSNEQVNDL